MSAIPRPELVVCDGCGRWFLADERRAILTSLDRGHCVCGGTFVAAERDEGSTESTGLGIVNPDDPPG